MNLKAIKNVADLVLSGVAALKAEGLTDAQIAALLPIMAKEAVLFLQQKAAA